MSADSERQPVKIGFNELAAIIKEWAAENGVRTLIGTMLTSQGVLAILFSHRLNKDFHLIVTGTDVSRVQQKIYESLGVAP